MEKDTVTINREEYEEMQKELSKLYALVAAGVDNWDGWDIAIGVLREEYPDYFD